jgi:hypothetical protein
VLRDGPELSGATIELESVVTAQQMAFVGFTPLLGEGYQNREILWCSSNVRRVPPSRVRLEEPSREIR